MASHNSCPDRDRIPERGTSFLGRVVVSVAPRSVKIRHVDAFSKKAAAGTDVVHQERFSYAELKGMRSMSMQAAEYLARILSAETSLGYEPLRSALAQHRAGNSALLNEMLSGADVPDLTLDRLMKSL